MATKYHVEIALDAYDDLDKAFQYIAENSLDDEIAKLVMRDIHKMILSLAEMPYRFPLSKDFVLAKKGYHSVVVKGYVVLYLIDDMQHLVTVAGIFYGTMNYSRFL